MTPKPISRKVEYKPAGKLMGKAALITGGDSGIGRAVAVMFAQEGADVAIVYLDEHDDAEETKRMVESHGRKCITIAGDAGDENFCRSAVERAVSELGRLDVLINNASEQHPQESIEDITAEQLERTFRTNVFSYFFMAKHALPHLKEGSAIINTASVQAYKGNPTMLDYGATKGAEVTFTRALSKQLVEKGIRVNAVAPGPVWTPLIPSTMPEKTPTAGTSSADDAGRMTRRPGDCYDRGGRRAGVAGRNRRTVDRAPHYVLSVVLPGAAHVLRGRHVAGWAMGLGWAAGWNVVILGTWVIPESFPAWAVPAAWSAVTAAWVSAPVTAGMLGKPGPTATPSASPPAAVPAPTAAPAGNS